MSAVITTDEWLAELERVGGFKDADGMSIADISTSTGRNTRWVRDRIGELVRAGRIAVGRSSHTRIDGVTTTVPVYRLLPAERRLNKRGKR